MVTEMELIEEKLKKRHIPPTSNKGLLELERPKHMRSWCESCKVKTLDKF